MCRKMRGGGEQVDMLSNLVHSLVERVFHCFAQCLCLTGCSGVVMPDSWIGIFHGVLKCAPCC